MCHDNFVFGLHSGVIHTELLKSHLKADNTPKTMQDVVTDAKAQFQPRKGTNSWEATKGSLEEQVSWTSPWSCHWCGDQKGRHAWKVCQARGKTCAKCGGNDHFAKVCLQDGKPKSQDKFPRQTNYRKQNTRFRQNLKTAEILIIKDRDPIGTNTMSIKFVYLKIMKTTTLWMSMKNSVTHLKHNNYTMYIPKSLGKGTSPTYPCPQLVQTLLELNCR